MTRIIKVRTPEASAYYGLPVGAELDLDQIINLSSEFRLYGLDSAIPTEVLERQAEVNAQFVRSGVTHIRQLSETMRSAAKALDNAERDLSWARASLAERALGEEKP